MSDSISIIMSTLSAIQCQLQPEAPNSSPKKDFVDVHVSLSNHEVEKDGISGKSDACKILDDNDNKNEDSTNQYDRFDDIIGNYNENFSTKKQNIVELSDDASSPQKLAKPNEAKKVIDVVVHGLSLSYNGFGDNSIWYMPWAFTVSFIHK
ncbi:hypothetical protein LINPERHAP2_LOCUS39248 [Linum perenne]